MKVRHVACFWMVFRSTVVEELKVDWPSICPLFGMMRMEEEI